MGKYIAILLLTISWSAFAETIPDYDRDDWNHWTDHDGDCLDTRHELLMCESLTSVTFKQDEPPRVCRRFHFCRVLSNDRIIRLESSLGWLW